MAKNVQGVIFLRNGSLYANHAAAVTAIQNHGADLFDGEAILARYTAEDETIKTIVGFKYAKGAVSSLTLIDVEGLIENAKALVEALRTEINNKLGTGVTLANTATAQLAALSGGTFTPGTSASGDTSVEGAKAYAYELIGTLDYTDTAVAGSYVSEVDQADGRISVTRVELPSVTGEVESKKVVMSVSEDKGEISVTKGTIESADKTVVISNLAEGNGIDFKVNIDGETLIADETTGEISVASAALTQYVGDENTIHISAVNPTTNTKTISSFLTIEKVTTGLSEEVKEEYHLVGSDHVTIGDPVKIYKDSHIVSIEYQDDPAEAHYQNLIYTYVDVSGNTQEAYVDISELVLEVEFASGITVTNHIAHGVVDPTSEKDSQDTPVDFLTVGSDGFKVSGIKDEINRKLNTVVENLDADVSGNSTHVTVGVVETDGVITDVTVSEDNIANADDLAELSGKTITNIKSTNASIDIATANTADDTVEVDVTTDASKIKMSGFTVSGTSSFSGIAESDSVSQAFDKANAVITENERVTAAALNDLDERLEEIESGYVGTVKVNDVALTETDHAVNVQISGSTAAPSGTVNDPAIIVNTDQNTGAITLGIGYIDCGTYDD